MVKLSIIVPIYNVEQYLRKCVDSLLAQDYEDYEIILVDDGSTDSCPSICDEYGQMYDVSMYDVCKKCIRVIHQENRGLSAARNTGIEVAQGEYVMFVDSDDYIEPNVLKGLMTQIERDNLDVLRFRFQNVNENYEVFNPYKHDYTKDNDYSGEVTEGITFLNERMGTQCYAVMYIIRRVLLDGCIFTPGIYFEDTDWTPRMLVRAKRVASADTIVYNYLIRIGSITKAVERAKQKKVLDDLMRLIGALQKQAKEIQLEGKDNIWFERMIGVTVISIISKLSTLFYDERKEYLAKLRELGVYPIRSKNSKARLINLSPRLAVELLHVKNGRR